MNEPGVAAQCRADLQRQGFAVLPRFLSPEQLVELRLEADTLFEMAQEGQHLCGSGGGGNADVRWGADACGSCIFESIPGHRCTPELRCSYDTYRRHRSSWPLRPAVWRILFESQLAQLVTALLGEAAALFNDQYILKPPCSAGSAFAWHRDSDWCRGADVQYRPYISVWCALDDMTAANGCFVARPGSHLAAPLGLCAPPAGATGGSEQAAQQQEQQQQLQPRLPQQQGSQGELQAAVPLEVPAGTVIVTADTVLHCSGPNRSQHMRRAWMPQFSAAPLLRRDGTCVSLAIPLAARAERDG